MKSQVQHSVPVLLFLLQLDWKPCLADSNGGTAQYKYYHYNNYDPNNPHGSPQDPNTDSKDPYSRDYSQNYVNYGFDYGGGISYDYSDVKTDPLQCFSCHYHIQYGHAVGMKECNDPFNKTVIPDVTCEGPCGKVYRKLDNVGEFMIVRNCMPHCKDIRDSEGYTQCCSTSFCNTAARPTFISSQWTALVTCALASITVILQR